MELVLEAFEQAWKNKGKTLENSARSSYFVSQLARAFSREFNGKAIVQFTDENGRKTPGEWLLDIAIVSEKEVGTNYKNRKANIVEKIIWAIESEFSTKLHEFCNDFGKLLHIKADQYLYVAGLNQCTKKPRKEYIDALIELAASIVQAHEIDKPFYIVFVPTPGKTTKNNSLWDTLTFEELKSWLHIVNLSKIPKI